MNASVPCPTTSPTVPSPALIADWRDFVFLHFAIEAEELAPHIPYPLDTVDGRAFVSLVSFWLRRLRPARGLPAALGRWLCRPVSDHLFLNVRTYVRGPAGPGIHFIAEWINNPLSLRLGPLLYGLPYRLAQMERTVLNGSGLQRITVRERRTGLASHLVVPAAPRPAEPTEPAGAADTFLLERHLAYTHFRGRGRWFTVAHPRWTASRFQLARLDTALLASAYPWFRHARFVGGHLADGFADVGMSAPQGIGTSACWAGAEPLPAGLAGR